MDTLGTALAFPLQADGRGGLLTVKDEAAVEHSLRAIIASMRGSHTLEPWLGLPPLVFKPIEDLLAIAELIKDAIIAGDDRIEPEGLEVQVGIDDSGQMPVTVTYRIVTEATERTLHTSYRTLG